MKIYVIGGKAKSGKNTFGEYLREELKEYSYKPCVMHITEPLYGYARNYFEWNGNDRDKPREFLQKMGIEIIKEKMYQKSYLIFLYLHITCLIRSLFYPFFLLLFQFPFFEEILLAYLYHYHSIQSSF